MRGRDYIGGEYMGIAFAHREHPRAEFNHHPFAAKISAVEVIEQPMELDKDIADHRLALEDLAMRYEPFDAIDRNARHFRFLQPVQQTTH